MDSRRIIPQNQDDNSGVIMAGHTTGSVETETSSQPQLRNYCNNPNQWVYIQPQYSHLNSSDVLPPANNVQSYDNRPTLQNLERSDQQNYLGKGASMIEVTGQHASSQNSSESSTNSKKFNQLMSNLKTIDCSQNVTNQENFGLDDNKQRHLHGGADSPIIESPIECETQNWLTPTDCEPQHVLPPTECDSQHVLPPAKCESQHVLPPGEDKSDIALPVGLRCMESGQREAVSKGIWTTDLLAKETTFGPLPDGGTEGSDCLNDNYWLYMISVTTSVSRAPLQNIVAYKHYDEVYFRVLYDIDPGTELVVGYCVCGISSAQACQDEAQSDVNDSDNHKSRVAVLNPSPKPEKIILKLKQVKKKPLKSKRHSRKKRASNSKEFNKRRDFYVEDRKLDKNMPEDENQALGDFDDADNKDKNSDDNFQDLNSDSGDEYMPPQTKKVSRKRTTKRSSKARKTKRSTRIKKLDPVDNVSTEKPHTKIKKVKTKQFSSKECHQSVEPQQKSAELGGLEPQTTEMNEEINTTSDTTEEMTNNKPKELPKTPGKSHTCDTCGFVFTAAGPLKRHIKIIHLGLRPYSCDVCGRAFGISSHLKRHMQTHSGIKPYSCSVCDKRFGRMSYLQYHENTHKTAGERIRLRQERQEQRRPHVCEFCEKRFPTKDALDAHSRSHTGAKPFICSACGKTFSQSNHIRLHMRLHEAEESRIAQLFPSHSSSGNPNGIPSGNLQEPQQNVGEYPCDSCGRKFNTIARLQSHMTIHTKPKSHTCHICGMTFANLRKHMKTHNGNKEHICEICNRGFSTKSGLSVHQRSHSGEKPYVCPVCSRAFPQSGNLQTHLRRHTGDRPYKCTSCEKSFADAASLVRHKRIHTGEQPFSCPTCQKSFTQYAQLYAHRKTHSSERPYACDTCGKRFKTPNILNEHLRIHSGEKPFACTNCDKRFTQRSTRMKHMRGCLGNKQPELLLPQLINFY